MVLLALMLALPLAAGAQAFKCTDAATGRVLYTDQPCKGGQAVVPARTPEQRRADDLRADAARQRDLQRQEAAQQREQARQDSLAAARSAQDAARAAQRAAAAAAPAESAACLAARNEASFRAASVTATEQQIRTARANAALACGQAPPPEIVVAPHWYPRPDRYRFQYPSAYPPVYRPHPRPPGFAQPPSAARPPPYYAPGTEPLPMR